MKYLPIHKAMVPHLTVGMTVFNSKPWRVTGHVNPGNDVAVAECLAARRHFLSGLPCTTQVLQHSDLLQMYISRADILKLKVFNGRAYISKYAASAASSPYATGLPTHAELKLELKLKQEYAQELVYLPMCETMLAGLKPGMHVVHNGGAIHNRQGYTGTILSLTEGKPPYLSRYSHPISVLWQSGHTSDYTVEWAMKNLYISIADIKALSRVKGEEYCTEFAKFIKTAKQLQTKQETWADLLKWQREKETLAVKQREKEMYIVGTRWLAGFFGQAAHSALSKAHSASIKAKEEQLYAEVQEQIAEFEQTKVKNQECFAECKMQKVHHKILANSIGALKAKVQLALNDHPERKYDLYIKHSTAEVIDVPKINNKVKFTEI